VTAIIALHSVERIRAFLMPRDDPWPMRLGRTILSLLLTGLAVEAALVPIALFHFHKSGLYGVLANLFAIPWTTFVIMPLEAAALLFDMLGLGAPFWAATGWSIDQLLGLAHWVEGQEGAVTTITAMPRGAFGLIMAGGLWLCLWRGRVRVAGLAPFAIGALWVGAAPAPDILLTGDGRHLVVVNENGAPHMLRERSGDYMLGLMSEAAGYDGDPLPLSAAPNANCSRDACMMVIERDGRRWSLMATRSQHFLRWDAMVSACSRADIVVSERRLPKACVPRWLKLDRETLSTTGGVSITLGNSPKVESVTLRTAGHPWAPGAGPFVSSGGSNRRGGPGSVLGRGDNAAPHTGGSRDQGGSSALHDGTS
jgi:competence protein ComEC